jgi:CheY-like chemotaxis protein
MLKENSAKTALVVEDSPTQAMRLKHVLSEHGLTTIWARDGEEGLHCAQLLMPDIIILDIDLPGMNGLQVCKHLKDDRRTRSISVILLTKFDDREIVRSGLQAGAIEYIPKDESSDEALLETLMRKGLIEAAMA